MAMCVLLGFLVSCCFLLLLSAADETGHNGDCPQFFHCGNLAGDIHFPFTNTTSLDCGLPIDGCNDDNGDQLVQLGNMKWYKITNIAQDNSFSVMDHELGERFCSENSSVFNYSAPLPPASPLMSFHIDMEHNTTLRSYTYKDIDGHPIHLVKLADHNDFSIYYCPPPRPQDDKLRCPSPTCSCSDFHLPGTPLFPSFPGHPFAAEYTIKVALNEDCRRCYYRRGGRCRLMIEENFSVP